MLHVAVRKEIVSRIEAQHKNKTTNVGGTAYSTTGRHKLHTSWFIAQNKTSSGRSYASPSTVDSITLLRDVMEGI